VMLSECPEALERLYRGYVFHRRGEEKPGDLPHTPYRVPVYSNTEGKVSARYVRTYVDFTRGSAENEEGRYEHEGPRHRVTIARRFAIGRYPVTFDEYDRFCEATRREKTADAAWGGGGGRSSMSAGIMRRLTLPGYRKRPAGPIGCRLKRNGDTPAGPARRPGIRSVTRSRPATPITPTRDWTAPTRSALIRQIVGVSTTCTAMSSNGSRTTGMKITVVFRSTVYRGRTRKPPQIGICASCAAGLELRFGALSVRLPRRPPLRSAREQYRVPSGTNTFLIPTAGSRPRRKEENIGKSRATSFASCLTLLLSVRRRPAAEHCPQDGDE
jgi:hypothetical protein